MADKECSSYEVSNGSHNQQKATATSIQLPSLTSKPLKQQQQIMKEKDDQGDSSSPPSGYYFNVAQKGKLILPTALWVLLIIAGISFLTLLASLNHTVDTLDTLVELEQEKEAQQRYEHYERLHHLQHGSDEHHGQQHNKKHQHQNEEASFGRSRQPSRKPEQESSSRRHHELESSATESESSAMMLGPFSSSWFSFPSWASLEPLAAREHTIVSKVKPEASASHRHIVSSGNQLMPPQVESMMNDMMRQMMGPADRVGGSVPEISGSFIISSSSDGSNMQMSSGSGATRDQPSDMMDSIFKQVMPMLDSLTMMGSSELTKDAPKSSQKQREAQPVEPQVQGPMISANIENLNINLNGNNGEQDSKKADDDDDKENNSNKPAASEQAEIEDLAKTIDSVVSKLMGQPTTSAPSNHDLDPMVEVVRIGSEPTHHHHHNHRKNHRLEQVESQSLPASLSSLLMPLGIGNQLMPIQSLEIGSDSSPFGPSSILVADERPSHRHSHGRPEVAKASSSLEEVMKHAHQLPEGPQMIISIASDEPQADQKQQSLQLPELASLITGQPIGHHSAGSSDSHRAPQRTSGGQSPYELPVGSPISSLLDSFRDFDQTVAATANKQHEHHHSTKKPIDELQKLKEDAKWDVLSNDLADSFLQGLLQSPQPFGSGELGLQSIGQQQQPQSIILVNGKPLDQSERQKSPEASKDRDSKSPTTPSEDTSELGAKSISDVLNLLFGPTSSLAPSTASSASTSSSTTKSTSTTKESQKASDEESSVEKFFKEMKNQLEESVSSPATIIKTDGPQSGSPSELFSLIQPSPALASKSDETSTKAAKDSNDSFMNDFIGTMFTLPQFGESSSQQREVGSNSGGSSSGGSSSGGSSSGGSSSGGSSPSDEPWEASSESNEDDEGLESMSLDDFLSGQEWPSASFSQELDPDTLEYEMLE